MLSLSDGSIMDIPKLNRIPWRVLRYHWISIASTIFDLQLVSMWSESNDDEDDSRFYGRPLNGDNVAGILHETLEQRYLRLFIEHAFRGMPQCKHYSMYKLTFINQEIW